MKWILCALGLAACTEQSGGGRMFVDASGGTGGDAGSGFGDGGSGGFIGDGGTGGTGGMPMDLPSRQRVTFAITNASVADRYVVTEGWYCDDFEIDAGGSPLALTLGFQCLCECPNPGSPTATRYRRLAPGASFELIWDARQLLSYSEPYDCASHGWPGVPPTTQILGVHQPVSAGPYVAVFGIERSLPMGCFPIAGDDYGCNAGGGMSTPPNIQQICPSTAAQSTPFTLPQMGDLMVPVTLQ